MTNATDWQHVGREAAMQATPQQKPEDALSAYINASPFAKEFHGLPTFKSFFAWKLALGAFIEHRAQTARGSSPP